MKRFVIVALLLAACAENGGGRYAAATDPGSRYGFAYVIDRQTKKWVNRECELRVSPERGLGEVHVQLFRPGSAQSGGLMSADFETRDGYRVWRIADVMHDDDLAGKVAYGVQIEWPRPGQSTDYDPMEIFHMPRPGNTPPNAWSPWLRAADTRAGGFAFLGEAEGSPPETGPPPAHPFEMRCRFILDDVPGVIR